MSYFSSDRLSKYSLGSVRLLILVFVAIVTFGGDFPAQYASSLRWITHIYIGSIGAMVNVQIFPFGINLLLLAIAGMLIVGDVIYFSPALTIYAMKTFGGDYIAGKLDTTEWLLVLVFSFVAGPSLLYATAGTSFAIVMYNYMKVLGYMFAVQVFCECGDNYWESYSFFRYRYSYEVASIVLLFFCNFVSFEKEVVVYDMVICLFYRISNWIIILFQTGDISLYLKKFLFTIAGYKLHTRLMHIDNPVIATLVMKQSVHKGFFLERYTNIMNTYIQGITTRYIYAYVFYSFIYVFILW